MLVYANNLSVQGPDASRAVFKAIAGWLKEKLGFGLRPDVLKAEGTHKGRRNENPARLRIHRWSDDDGALYAFVLTHADDAVHGRQWTTEVGVRETTEALDVSCVVKTDEISTLVSGPVSASQPRVIRYIISNIRSSPDADFRGIVPGETLKPAGQDRDSYEALLAEIEDPARKGAIVLLSPTREGIYLVDRNDLQRTLFGLAQVVPILADADTYEMERVLGRSRSAWDGALNVLSVPTLAGAVWPRLVREGEISSLGNASARISQILAWVTASTNISRLRSHLRPERVMLLSMRRRMDEVRAASARMTEAELRRALNEAAEREGEQQSYFDELVTEHAHLQDELSRYRNELDDTRNALQERDYQMRQLKKKKIVSGSTTHDGIVEAGDLLRLVARREGPTTAECVELVRRVYPERVSFLPSAHASAERHQQFTRGRELLDQLLRLVTEYRDRMMIGGDSDARHVFGKNEYAATEAETLPRNQRRRRTFVYKGENVVMLRHLKIGVDDDRTRTIRTYFHWDGDDKVIVIGHCGEHLPIKGH